MDLSFGGETIETYCVHTMKSDKQLIQFFFDHLSEIKPLLMLGYNVRQDLFLVSISLIMVWAPLLAARNNGHKRSKRNCCYLAMSANTDFTCFSQRSCKSDADLCLSPKERCKLGKLLFSNPREMFNSNK